MTDCSSERPSTILVVDDEQSVRDMFAALLQVSGYQVLTAASGEAALSLLQGEAAQGRDGLIDLVVLDVLMPGVDGYQVCQFIKSHPRLRYIPVLMVTALGSLRDRRAGVEMGADDYVVKPFLSEELLVRVRALVRTARVQRELLERNEELAALRGFTESILQNMGEGLLTVNDALQLTTLNQAAARLLGIDAAGWSGKHLADVAPGLAPLSSQVERVLSDGQSVTYSEITLARGDEGIPLRVSITPLADSAGASAGAICVLEDLRPVQVMEAERQRLDRLASLGRMAASVAHEIRNPLATLSLGVAYLQKSLGVEARYQEPMERIQRQIDRLGQIVNEFLAFARPPKLALARCDVAAMLDRAMELVEQPLLAKGISVQREYDAGLGEILVDAEQMERVLSNLILNAMDATEAGDALYLRTRRLAADEWATRYGPGRFEGDVALIEIADTGRGISPQDLGHIFEPFFTTRPKGAGLGLAIAQRIVEEHGGRIHVSSQPGEGTTFAIGLPRRI